MPPPTAVITRLSFMLSMTVFTKLMKKNRSTCPPQRADQDCARAMVPQANNALALHGIDGNIKLRAAGGLTMGRNLPQSPSMPLSCCLTPLLMPENGPRGGWLGWTLSKSELLAPLLTAARHVQWR